MLAVCNTSPISNLASIGRLDLMPTQFESVWIPVAVANELDAHPNPTVKALIASAFSAGWFRLQAVEDSTSLKILRSQLHSGEAEAIELAKQKKADIVLIDESEGRRIAISHGLSVTGVLGILLGAKEKGQITLLRPELEKLRTLAGFYIAPALAVRVLAMASES